MKNAEHVKKVTANSYCDEYSNSILVCAALCECWKRRRIAKLCIEND